MLRTNLATRPFYNEGAVRLVLLGLGLVVVAATLFNVARVIQLSRRDTQLVTQASRDEARATELRAAAARLRATVDPKTIERASTDARQANSLIDRRVFSWTDLFNRFETTLPDDVRITTIRPKVDARRGIMLTVVVSARAREDVNQFIENLEGTGAFRELLAHEDHLDDQGQLEATIETIYVPDAVPLLKESGR
jgi:Tfp pilus assembly protein PilN